MDTAQSSWLTIGRHLPKLFLNHLDAWAIAFMIGFVALLIHDAVNLQMVSMLLAMAGVYWFGFAYNDYCDAPHDRFDARKGGRNFFVHVPVSPQIMWAGLISAALLPIAVFASFGWRGWVATGVGLFMIWAYSAPPLRLKNKPVIDLLVHALFVESFPYYITLLMLGVEWGRLDWTLVLFFGLTSLAAQLDQQSRDFHVDSETDRNFATLIGLGWTRFWLRVVTVATAVVAVGGVLLGIIPVSLVPYGAISLPFLIQRFLPDQLGMRSRRFTLALVGLGVVYSICLWWFGWL